MSYSFNGSSQYLSALSAPVTAAPLTIALRGNSNSNALQQIALGLGNGDVPSGQFVTATFAGDQAGDPLSAFISEATLNARANSSTGYVTGTTCSVVCVYESESNRTAYKDGAAGTNNTTLVIPTGINRLGVAALVRSTVVAYFNGQLSECAIWNVALNAAEAASLGRHFRPSRIRPQSLVFYAPLLRNLQDVRGGIALTNNNGATVANHPRVY